MKLRIEVAFLNPLVIQTNTVTPAELGAINLKLDAVKERLNIMPTEAELDAKLNDLAVAISNAVEAEIVELGVVLSQQGVPQSALDKVDAMRASVVTKIGTIVNPPVA